MNSEKNSPKDINETYNNDENNEEDSNMLLNIEKKIIEDKNDSNILKNNKFILKCLIIVISLFIIISYHPKTKQNDNINKINIPSNNNSKENNQINNKTIEKPTDQNQIPKDTDKEKDKETDKEKDKETDKEKDKEKDKETDKEKDKEKIEDKNKDEQIINSDIIHNINISGNNKGFLNITTHHKGKFTKYDINENNQVYKDLYNSISYTPITENNTIIPSTQYSNDDYFQLCESKKLLDETKYKRSPNPKISVIVAYFNRNKFNLYVALRSIQNQSFKDIEIIYVDDGSTQNKIDEVKEEMKNDNRIILVTHKHNKGTLMTRADGVRYASGEYIILLDQDDMYYDNLVFEKLYKKAKELNADLVQFATLQYNTNRKTILNVQVQKNVFITQPELRTAFMQRISENRLSNCATRMVWDKFIRRTVYLEAINDLGDEYLNHRVFLYEDTIMMFELSQVAYSYFFYDFIGYRLNVHLQGKSRDSTSQNIQIIAMNQLLFIKLLLYKIDPKFDRYHIFKEWGFSRCSAEVMYLSRNDIDLLQEVIEVIDGLEKKYKNTARELLDCVTSIKKRFGIP